MVMVGDTGIDVDVLDSLPDLPRLPDDQRARGRADALRLTEGYLGIANEVVRAAVVMTRFAKVVATDPRGRLYTRAPVRGRAFVSGDPGALLQFPKNDPYRPGQDRYQWFADPNEPGVEYGFLFQYA